jgi:hypothetical protein
MFLLREEPLLPLLRLSHLSCTALHLLDALLDLNQLLQLLIVVSHQYVARFLLLLEYSVSDIVQGPPLPMFLIDPAIPSVQGVVGDQFATLLEILDLVDFFGDFSEAADVGADARDLPLVVDGVGALSLEDLLQSASLDRFLDHTGFHIVKLCSKFSN